MLVSAGGWPATAERFDTLKALHLAYKAAIGEEQPSREDLDSLRRAIQEERIHFYGCLCGGELVACCSVSLVYSTFCYGKAGVFEDFYIAPKYRHRGIARGLVQYAYETSGVSSLTVGCADCDLEMYRSLGFRIPLGNMLAFEC